MSIKNIVLTLVIAFVALELIEHVVFPLLWLVLRRKKKSACGAEGMLGKIVEVKQWEKNEGRVFVNGELWSAVSDIPLMRGDKAVIERVEGLTLKVKPLDG